MCVTCISMLCILPFAGERTKNHIKQNVNLDELKEICYLVVDLFLFFLSHFTSATDFKGLQIRRHSHMREQNDRTTALNIPLHTIIKKKCNDTVFESECLILRATNSVSLRLLSVHRLALPLAFAANDQTMYLFNISRSLTKSYLRHRISCSGIYAEIKPTLH